MTYDDLMSWAYDERMRIAKKYDGRTFPAAQEDYEREWRRVEMLHRLAAALNEPDGYVSRPHPNAPESHIRVRRVPAYLSDAPYVLLQSLGLTRGRS